MSVRCLVHTPVRMFELPLSQSDQRIISVFQSVYSNSPYGPRAQLVRAYLLMGYWGYPDRASVCFLFCNLPHFGSMIYAINANYCAT